MLSNVRSLLTKNLQQCVQQCIAPLHVSSIKRGQYIEVQQKDGVREIKLNEPTSLNSLSTGMMDSILAELNRDLDNKDLRCIVLSACGPVWSAGHNLKELTPETGSDHHVKVLKKCTEIVTNIYKSPVPIIAKVNGLAAAAGVQLVASCDIVVCSDTSSFSTPAANFGVFASTPGIAMSRTMPRLKSFYMLVTGLPITAQEAYIAGLVSVVTPEAQLDAEMTKVTDSIKQKSRAVIKLGKEFYYKQLNMNIKDAYKHGAEIMRENISMNDGVEGIRSFIEKRQPKWSHK